MLGGLWLSALRFTRHVKTKQERGLDAEAARYKTVGGQLAIGTTAMAMARDKVSCQPAPQGQGRRRESESRDSRGNIRRSGVLTALLNSHSGPLLEMTRSPPASEAEVRLMVVKVQDPYRCQLLLLLVQGHVGIQHCPAKISLGCRVHEGHALVHEALVQGAGSAGSAPSCRPLAMDRAMRASA